jgi:hypothetical protein
VIFKDQSSNVIRKFKAKEAKTKQVSLVPARHSIVASPPSEEDLDAEEVPEIVRSDTSLSVFSITPSVEDCAMNFFFVNYIIDEQGPTRGHLNFLPTVAECDGASDCLISSIKAVGLAGFAHSAQEPSLLTSARYQYLKAIQATNEALRSPLLVKKDSTLIAIMILSIFETVSGTNQKSLKAWAEHVFGAAALLKLRGRAQLHSPHTRRLFIQVASSLMITSIQRNLPVPSFILEWVSEGKKSLRHPDTGYHSQEIMMEYTVLNASIRDGSISDPDTVLARCLELDGRLRNVFSNLPPDWGYEIIHTDADSDQVYKGCYHVYYDYWIAQIWNGMRTIRILLNEEIRNTLLEGFSSKPPRFVGAKYTTQFQVSTDTMYALQADILATVPQHLGYVTKHRKDVMRFPWTDFGEKSRDDFPVVRMSGPYFLIWPLSFCGIIDIATDEIRQFVVKSLQVIGRDMGIKQALVLAEVIQSKSSFNFT